MSDLLVKAMTHYDPITRGFTPAGLVSGSCVLNGMAHARRSGGANLYRGTDADAIDLPVGAASPNAATLAPFPCYGHAPGQRYYYQGVAVGGGGVEAIGDRRIVTIETDDEGHAMPPVPAAPGDLCVDPLAGGVFRVSWFYVPSDAAAGVVAFRVYTDNGTGTMDYTTPIATVSARASLAGQGAYALTTDAFTHDADVAFGVRAVSSAAEEANTVTATATADSIGPALHGVTDATWGADE